MDFPDLAKTDKKNPRLNLKQSQINKSYSVKIAKTNFAHSFKLESIQEMV